MKLSTRLVAGFGALMLMLLVVIGMAGWQMHGLAGNSEAFATNIVPSLDLQKRITYSLAVIRRGELNHIVSDELAEMQRIEASMDAEHKRLDDAIDVYRKTMVVDAEDRRLIEDVRTKVDHYMEGWEKLRLASRKTAADPAASTQAKSLLDARLGDYRAAQEAVDAGWDYNMKLSERAAQDSIDTYARAKVSMAVAALVALGLGLAGAWLITRSVLRQIGGEPAYAKEVVARIAQGNLAMQVALRAGDRTSLLADMEDMRERLSGLVTQVRATSENIATGSTQIASGNVDLSQRTEEQASNLQQTAASMEQLSGTVKMSAETAVQASQLAAGAAAAARQGGQVVSQVVDTMHEISTASKRIADIIGTIDGIAFQTNILALNAAVEAARAGEQGRGFAVVAGEVRTLARRSAEAAREIKSLIGANVDKVEAGTRQVNDAGASMDGIVTQVERVNVMIGELSSAAAEQSAGIGQVNDAMSQLDQVTQQNAALVEESAAAAESLRNQADNLAQAIGVFRIADAPSGSTASTTRASTAAAELPRATAPMAQAQRLPASKAGRAPASRPPEARALAHAGDGDWASF